MFDPNLPQENTLADAAQMRNQFNGLKALIDALQSINAAQVDAVNTLPPGTPASVSINLNGTVMHLTFGIPQGIDGQPGPPGPPIGNAIVDSVSTLPPGSDASAGVSFDGTNLRFTFGIPTGNEGPPGPPIASAVVDSVSTLPPGSGASAGVSFDGTNLHFTFAIPQGNDGAPGTQGPPGEVTQAALDAAQLNTLGQSSNNSNAVGTLDTPYGDPESEELRNKYNELILALRR
jgi:hypothetical protein